MRVSAFAFASFLAFASVEAAFFLVEVSVLHAFALTDFNKLLGEGIALGVMILPFSYALRWSLTHLSASSTLLKYLLSMA